jgi:cystathionine beta-lyase/cystathionine gamma-synthase
VRGVHFNTKTVHAGQVPDPITGAISTPIYQTATYAIEEIGKTKGYDYSRTSTPTRRVLEKNLSMLEGGKDATAFSSGLASIDAILHRLSQGDRVAASHELYGGTTRLFLNIFARHGIKFDFVDLREPYTLKNHIGERTKLVFIETPSNPTLKLVDIKAVVEVASEKDIPVIVDNTFMTPYFQKPLALGAETVVHSLTKFLSGHNDVIGGCVISNNEKMIEDMKFMVKAVGATLCPFESWLTLRGIKTLHLRMERCNESAIKIARWLEANKKVDSVIYPGLSSHPQHELAKMQMTGFGGMICFTLQGGLESAKRCVQNLKIWSLAESLGGVESLVTHPATMTHTSLTREERDRLGITDGLIRLSVGIEDVEDLIEDLDQAMRH